MPWVTVPIDGWKDHPDSPHLDPKKKPVIDDSSAHATSGVVSPDEPDTFWSGVLKSITSGDALSAGVQGAGGFIRGALADLPSSIYHGAMGTGKTVSGLLQGDPETYKGMYQGTKDLANQVIDTTTHAGGRPHEFGRMMGQMTGQPLVTEGIARGGAINPARFEAPIPRSAGALPESTLPIIDIPPTMEGLPEGLHAQNQLARIGAEPIPTQFEPANIEPIPTEFGPNATRYLSGLQQTNRVFGGVPSPELMPDQMTPIQQADQNQFLQSLDWEREPGPVGMNPRDVADIVGDVTRQDINVYGGGDANLTPRDSIDVTPLRQQNVLEPPVESDPNMVNDTFDQMNTSPEQMQAPQQKTEAIQAAQDQMGQATQQSIPTDPTIQRAAELERLNSIRDRQGLYDLFNRWVDEHRRIRESGGMGTPEQIHAHEMFNTANERIQNWGNEAEESVLTPTEEPTVEPQTETITGGEASADDRNVDVQEINNADPERLDELQDEWHRRWREAHNRGDTRLANYASRMADLVTNRVLSIPETPLAEESTNNPHPLPWQVVDMQDPENPIAHYATEEEAAQHLRDNPYEPYGYRNRNVQEPPDEPQATSRIPADIEEIRTATTSDELNRLYREWNEEYHQARASSNSAMEEHARNMSVLIDERLTNEFNQPESLGFGSPNPPTQPPTPQVDLGQLYHVYDQADGSVVATFNTRYQAMNFVDEPGNEHLDIAVRGEVPPATGVRKKTLTELREATGVPNPPITFGKQDLSIVTDLTEAQIARLRGGAGRDKRIDVKGRKPKEDRQVKDTGYDDMAKRALARTPDGDPGLTITDHSYGGSHKRYEIVYRGADGKAKALATVEETPEGWRRVPWLMADRTKGGKPAMYVMSAIAKMNATEQSGSISNHTANIIAQLTQRSDKLTARAGRKAARLKKEGSNVPPPD